MKRCNVVQTSHHKHFQKYNVSKRCILCWFIILKRQKDTVSIINKWVRNIACLIVFLVSKLPRSSALLSSDGRAFCPVFVCVSHSLLHVCLLETHYLSVQCEVVCLLLIASCLFAPGTQESNLFSNVACCFMIFLLPQSASTDFALV